MIFWTREIAGWLLVAFGLTAFVVVYQLALGNHLLELIPITIIGVFLFRGGIHLLKVAVAARACAEAQRRLYPDALMGSAPLPAARAPQRPAWRP